MAKVTRTVTLDYDVVEEFKLTYPKQKLSTVLNQLISSYVNLADRTQEPEEALIQEKKQIMDEKAELESKLVTIRAKLQAHKNKQNKAESIKWKFYEEVVLKRVPTYAKEKYELKYVELYKERAEKYWKNKK